MTRLRLVEDEFGIFFEVDDDDIDITIPLTDKELEGLRGDMELIYLEREYGDKND